MVCHGDAMSEVRAHLRMVTCLSLVGLTLVFPTASVGCGGVPEPAEPGQPMVVVPSEVPPAEVPHGDSIDTAQGDTTPTSPQPEEPVPDDKVVYLAFIESAGAAYGAINACYMDAIAQDPSLDARIVTMSIQVQFTEHGRSADVVLDPDFGATFGDCMRALIAHWTVPAPQKTVTLSASLTFTPR